MRMYQPTEARWEDSRLGRFVAHAGFGFLEELQRWSVGSPRAFWRAVAEEVGLQPDGGPTPGLGDTWPEPHGFDLAARLVGRHAALAPRRPALCAIDLDGRWCQRSYAELAADLGRVAAGLAHRGVRCGDRVAVALPIGLEAVVAMLALLQLGADVEWPCPSAEGRRTPALAACRWVVGGREPIAGVSADDLILFDGVAGTGDPECAAGQCPPAKLRLPCLPGQPITGLTLKAAWDLAAALDLGAGDVLMVRAEPDSPLWPWLTLGCLQLGAGLVIAGRRAPGDAVMLQAMPPVTHLGFCGEALKADHGNSSVQREVFESASLRLVAIFDGRIEAQTWNWLFEQLGHCRFPLVNCFGGPAWGGLLLAAFPGLPVKPCSLVGPMPGVDVCLQIDTGHSAGRLVCGNRWPGRPDLAEMLPESLVRARIDRDGYWFLD